MMDELDSTVEVRDKIREKLDIEQWALEHMMKMSDVQALGELTTYESMMNSFILSLSPYWPDGFKEKWDKVRMIAMGPEFSPDDSKHKERLMEKELLKAELIEQIGIGFTKKKKAYLRGGLKRLWEIYPPSTPLTENSSENSNHT
jgi:hypothetical protein